MGPMGPARFRRGGRRRGFVVGAIGGSAAARINSVNNRPRGYYEESHSDDQLMELEKLNELKEKGILTEEEFAAKKQILGI
jgi:hypothetical protein